MDKMKFLGLALFSATILATQLEARNLTINATHAIVTITRCTDANNNPCNISGSVEIASSTGNEQSYKGPTKTFAWETAPEKAFTVKVNANPCWYQGSDGIRTCSAAITPFTIKVPAGTDDITISFSGSELYRAPEKYHTLFKFKSVTGTVDDPESQATVTKD